MGVDVTVLVGGEAGQGILTVGDILTAVCQKAGFYIMGINEFESRIRGGHSFFQLRISDRPVHSPDDRIHLLMALNQETIELHKDELVDGGVALVEKKDDPAQDNLLEVPIYDLAKKAGAEITSNTVAAGACLALLGAPEDLCKDAVSRYFSAKGQTVVEDNIRAMENGFQAVEGHRFNWSFGWDLTEPKGAPVTGAKTIALGALAADCRFGAFYPMSPATGIMAELVSFADQLPLVVEQAEDEIAAVNMVIGASFAGVRSITATSGGGFCLMTEGLGLAGITETPVVIVNAQRPGPATGLPTRTGQADLLFVIRAAQDEFPRFVFAPGAPQEAFETTVRAFHLSEKYQVPAIILADKYLTDSLFTLETPLTAPETIERFVVGDKDMQDPKAYRRFELTPSGVSPRALPCAGKALVVVSGDEHRQDGRISEEVSDRNSMVEKRNIKTLRMLKEMKPPRAYHGDSEMLLVGWGSTEGAIREAVDRLRKTGVHVGSIHFGDLWPFVSEAAEKALGRGKRFVMVEQNSTCQLGQLIKQQTGLAHCGSVLKYSGRPFYPSEIVRGAKEFLGGSNG